MAHFFFANEFYHCRIQRECRLSEILRGEIFARHISDLSTEYLAEPPYYTINKFVARRPDNEIRVNGAMWSYRQGDTASMGPFWNGDASWFDRWMDEEWVYVVYDALPCISC